MIRGHIMYFFLISTIFVTVLAQGNVGDLCQMRATGAQGVCKLAADCPQAQELAANGISPTLCGIPFLTNRYIVCCEGAHNTVNNIPQPNENSFLNAANLEDRFLFLDNDDSVPVLPSIHRSKSEEKCVEYTKPVTAIVSAAPLTTDPDQIVSVQVEKCENAGLSLIVGGEPASAGEFPFMAAVGYNGDTEIEWSCGGTLISDYYVVTAAHCADTKFYGPPVKVRLGDLDLKSDNDNSIHADYDIASIIKHEGYRPPARYNDIALIRLASQVEFTQFIRPACLWSKTQLDTTKTIATGWGRKGVADDRSDKLLKVELNVFDNSLCSKTYPLNSKLPRGIVQTMLCAGELKGGKDTCQGDSGGPLIVQREKNRCIFHIVGITSFGKGCGGPNLPAVYTRISEYVSWIEKLIW